MDNHIWIWYNNNNPTIIHKYIIHKKQSSCYIIIHTYGTYGYYITIISQKKTAPKKTARPLRHRPGALCGLWEGRTFGGDETGHVRDFARQKEGGRWPFLTSWLVILQYFTDHLIKYITPHFYTILMVIHAANLGIWPSKRVISWCFTWWGDLMEHRKLAAIIEILRGKYRFKHKRTY